MDSCAFDPKYNPEDKASLEIYRLYEEEGIIQLWIAHSTQKEISHPNTPSWVKEQAAMLIFTMETHLTRSEVDLQERILAILAGNGSPDSNRQDATHIFEAQKYFACFVTTDNRILKKRDEITEACGINILKPSEFLDLIRKHNGGAQQRVLR